MIRINFKTLLARVEKKQNRFITLKEVSERSGCDRNALSRIVNHPNIVPSASVIDKLAQFFFNQLKTDDPTTHRECMKDVLSILVEVYPDNDEFWKDIPQSLKENKNVTVSEYWDVRDRRIK